MNCVDLCYLRYLKSAHLINNNKLKDYLKGSYKDLSHPLVLTVFNAP
jgi:hypothetical protein